MSKGLEALVLMTTGLINKEEWKKCYNTIEKELKALEILKKEPYISVNWYSEGTYEEYTNAIEKVKITEDEWNFVKEALL